MDLPNAGASDQLRVQSGALSAQEQRVSTACNEAGHTSSPQQTDGFIHIGESCIVKRERDPE